MMPPHKVGLLSILIAALLIVPGGDAIADSGLEVSGLGDPRAVPRSRSASRDAPALNYFVTPRPTLTAFMELGLLTVKRDASTLRLGFIGGLEIESENEAQGGGFPLPVGDIRFWRGYDGLTIAFEDSRLSHGVCATCILEFGFMFRHESEHYTGSNRGGEGTNYSDQSQVGDFVSPDTTLMSRLGRFTGYARAEARFYLPNRSAYNVGGVVDLYGSVRIHRRTALFVSLLAETQRGTALHQPDGDLLVHPIEFPDASDLRAMAGLTFSSSRGAIMIYGYAHRGHRKGLAVLTREQVVGLGVRLALGALD